MTSKLTDMDLELQNFLLYGVSTACFYDCVGIEIVVSVCSFAAQFSCFSCTVNIAYVHISILT